MAYLYVWHSMIARNTLFGSAGLDVLLIPLEQVPCHTSSLMLLH